MADFGDFRFPYRFEKLYFDEVRFPYIFEKLYSVESDSFIDLRLIRKPPIWRETQSKIEKRMCPRRDSNPHPKRDSEHC